jgi:hypothetical protein
MLNTISEGFIISLIIFTLNLELNPQLGNIWYRIDENKEYRIRPKNLLEYFIKPFKDTTFWHPKLWDINPYMFTTITTITYTLCSTTIKNLFFK